MANRALIIASRMLLAASLTVVVAACGTSKKKPTIEASDTAAADRFDGDISYKGAYPRAVVPFDALNPRAPKKYTVVKDDTLWDISGRFLTKPWLWPQIWDYNPQIQNPHLIFPGDEISIEYINGQPSLTLTRNGQQIGEGELDANGNLIPAAACEGCDARWSPRIRAESLESAIPTIPADAIQQFLINPKVVDNATLKAAPYVIGNRNESLMSSLGQEIFVRGNLERNRTKFGIFRKTKTLRDPESKKVLGYEVLHVAEAKLLNAGDPATMVITQNSRETLAGDVLLPSAKDGVLHNYTPRMPKVKGEGSVVSLVDAISQSGRDQIIVINMGKQVGIKVGDVLAIESRGKSMIDRNGRRKFDRVRLPNQRTGVVMVFQTFDEVSYALVMESTRPVKRADIVTGI